MTPPNHCGYFADLNIDFILHRQISKISSFVCSRTNEWADDLEFRVNSYDRLSGSDCELVANILCGNSAAYACRQVLSLGE